MGPESAVITSMRQLLDRRSVRQLGHDDGEFVAAEPGQKVIVLQLARDQMRDFPEQFIAGGVAERVVDLLEAVEIEQQQRRGRFRAAPAGQHIVDFAAEQGAVGEAGEGVIVSELFQLLLGGLALGDVLNSCR